MNPQKPQKIDWRCINCDKESRSHLVREGVYLCHSCYLRMDNGMIKHIADKIARITREWIRADLESMKRNRDIKTIAPRVVDKGMDKYIKVKADRLKELTGR